MPNYPFFAQEVSSLPYFITDDFQYYCHFDYDDKKMYIVNSKDQSMKIGCLPDESISWENHNFEKDIIKEAYACVRMNGKDSVTTYNADSGLMTRW